MDKLGTKLKKARKRAGHSLVQASVAMSVSVTTISLVEKKSLLPKNPLLQKAILDYINKYGG